MLMINQKIHPFTAQAVVNNIIQTITPSDVQTPKIFIFYPLDFTFVCPTELHAFQEAKHMFDQLGVTLYGISVDSVYSHLAWLEQPRQQGGIQGVQFPLISDITKNISRQFGVLDEQAGIAYRALFIVDHQNIIKAAQVTHNSIGRSIKETVRLTHAMLYSDQSGKACPADWDLDQKTFFPNKADLQKHLSS